MARDSLTEEDRDGGALRTYVLEMDVVGLLSRHRWEIDGQRRDKREKVFSANTSPDLRRFVAGVEKRSSPMTPSSATVQTRFVGDETGDPVTRVGLCSQNGVSPMIISMGC